MLIAQILSVQRPVPASLNSTGALAPCAYAAFAVRLNKLAASIRTRTTMDALRFAIGANKANEQRPTRGDVRHALLLALRTWPEQSQREIAEQVGCALGTVSTIKRDVFTAEHVAMPVTSIDSLGREQPTRKPRAPAIFGLVHLRWQGAIVFRLRIARRL